MKRSNLDSQKVEFNSSFISPYEIAVLPVIKMYEKKVKEEIKVACDKIVKAKG